jgi:hypothetical protein
MMISRKPVIQEIALRLDDHLTPMGFVRNRKTVRFCLADSASCIVVELQKSAKSNAETAIVAANVGLWNSTLSKRIGGPSQSDGLGAMDCQWWLRAGQIEDGQGRWWTAGAATDITALVGDMWSLLAPIVSLFMSLRSDADFLRYLLTIQGPFLDPMNRWAFAFALACAAGDGDAQNTARKALEEVGKTRTLPVGYRMLLQAAA